MVSMRERLFSVELTFVLFFGSATGRGCVRSTMALVHLVRVMRSNGRRLDFLGLTGTMLGDGEARLLADALNALPARDPAAEDEIIELKQVHLSEPVRDQLAAAGTRAGVDVRLSRQ